MDLRGKTILITGAGRGLGAAMAKRLAARGANLALLDLEEAGMVDVSDACRSLGVRVETYGANVAVERDVVGTFNLLEAARPAGTRLLFMSTCMVYDRATSLAGIREDHPTKPASPYAARSFIVPSACGQKASSEIT